MCRRVTVRQTQPIIAGTLGIGSLAGEADWIAKILLVVFMILFVVSLIMVRKTPSCGI